jgi:hypothetical protein
MAAPFNNLNQMTGTSGQGPTTFRGTLTEPAVVIAPLASITTLTKGP